MSRSKIFVFCDYYLPGCKAGGPIHALARTIESLGDEFDFFLLTRNRDAGDGAPYRGVERDMWTRVGRAQVIYTADLSLRHLRKRILQMSPAVIYLNSFFSVLSVRILLLRALRLVPRFPVVLAPRGEFSPGALGLKRLRKWWYRRLAVVSGLCAAVIWQASSEIERKQIERALGASPQANLRVMVAPDLPDAAHLGPRASIDRPKKSPGHARFIFFSRIAPMKNLPFALDAFRGVDGRVELDIYGPLEDPRHWRRCQKCIASLPKNILVRYRGVIPGGETVGVAARYHFFLLATQGESFGHAILEALAAGCPVVLSDRTPWREVSENAAGWCIPLEDPPHWRQIVQNCVRMDQEAYQVHSQAARQYAERWCRATHAKECTAELFRVALAASSDAAAHAINQNAAETHKAAETASRARA